MQWFGGKESDDVEEGSSSGGIGGRHFAVGGGILGLIGFVIYLFTGVNPSQLLSSGAQVQGTEEVWDSLFTAAEQKFTHPVLYFTRAKWMRRVVNGQFCYGPILLSG